MGMLTALIQVELADLGEVDVDINGLRGSPAGIKSVETSVATTRCVQRTYPTSMVVE